MNNFQIDQQHQRWIEIYNSAHERMLSDTSTVAKKDIGKDVLIENWLVQHILQEDMKFADSGYDNR